MAAEQNVATQEKLGEEVVANGNLDAVFDVFAADVVDHDPAPDQGPGAEGFKQFFTGLKTAFPDAKVTVDHIVTDDDNVAVAYTLEGTHDGAFLGAEPTGKKVSVRGMQIARFEDGKIVERWGSTDELGILKQLGVDPTAG